MARVRVRTPQGMGYLWEGTPLLVQLERHRVGVILDTWQGPMHYFSPSEIEVWSTTRYPLIQQPLIRPDSS
jgi:hypothetical protein